MEATKKTKISTPSMIFRIVSVRDVLNAFKVKKDTAKEKF